MRTKKEGGLDVPLICRNFREGNRQTTDILMVMISFGEKISGGVLLQSGVIPGRPEPHRFL